MEATEVHAGAQLAYVFQIPAKRGYDPDVAPEVLSDSTGRHHLYVYLPA